MTATSTRKHVMFLALALLHGACDHQGTPAPASAVSVPQLRDEERDHALATLFAQHESDCTPVTYDRALRQYILQSGDAMSVQFPDASAAPLIIASPATTYGVFLFRKDAAGWQPYLLAAGATTRAVRISRDGKTLYVISMWSREAPGDYFVAKLSSEQPGIECATLPRPAFSRSLDYGAFSTFWMNDDGRGSLLTKATLESEQGTEVRWYRYDTSDAAHSWSAAQLVSATEASAADGPQASTRPLSDDLLAELLAP